MSAAFTKELDGDETPHLFTNELTGQPTTPDAMAVAAMCR